MIEFNEYMDPTMREWDKPEYVGQIRWLRREDGSVACEQAFPSVAGLTWVRVPWVLPE